MKLSKTIQVTQKRPGNHSPDEVYSSAAIYLDPFCARIRIDDYSGPVHGVVELINQHTFRWVEKIIIKSRTTDSEEFIQYGFAQEASVVGYFSGDDMLFLTKYPLKQRKGNYEWNGEWTTTSSGFLANTTDKYIADSKVELATKGDSFELSELFKGVFPIYPTPVGDPDYLMEIMEKDVVYKVIKSEGRIVSAACAEINMKYGNAELSDCATLSEFSGKGYMKAILNSLIEDLHQMKIDSIYSISRVNSPGINRVFQSLGFKYTGCLFQNVRIGTGLEDMNIWSLFKSKKDPAESLF